MKKFLLLIISLISVITLSLSLSVTVLAEDSVESGASDSACPESSDENTDSSPFSEIYGLMLQNSDKIFSALAFISSVFLALTYRKGLIPTINTGLTAIKKSADAFENSTAESIVKTEQSLDFLTDKFALCISTLESMSKYIDELAVRLDCIEEEKKSASSLKNIMLSQIDMLYEIFMNSALPQYSKDAIGEKVSQMKKRIAVGEQDD